VRDHPENTTTREHQREERNRTGDRTGDARRLERPFEIVAHQPNLRNHARIGRPRGQPDRRQQSRGISLRAYDQTRTGHVLADRKILLACVGGLEVDEMGVAGQADDLPSRLAFWVPLADHVEGAVHRQRHAPADHDLRRRVAAVLEEPAGEDRNLHHREERGLDVQVRHAELRRRVVAGGVALATERRI
jgi:hypothetical protein